MRRPLRLGAAAALLAGTGLLGVLAITVQDPDSAFASGAVQADPLVADAAAQRVVVQRVVGTPAAVLRQASSPGETLLAVLGAPRPYTQEEAAAVQAFLESGGRVLLVDTYGHANSLSSPLGVTFERVRLVDPANATAALLDGGTFQVRWSAPTALQIAPDRAASALAASTQGSFLDRDGNGTIDASDLQGSFLLAVEAPVGNQGGLLVAVADNGPFAAATGDLADNAAWRRALLSHLLPAGGLLLVDESRHELRNPVAAAIAATTTAATLPPWNWVLGILGVGFLLLPLLPQASPAWAAHRFRPDRFIRRAEAAEGAGPAGGDIGGDAAGAGTVREGAFWTRRGVTALCTAAALALLGLVLSRAEAVTAAALLLMALVAAYLVPPVRLRATRGLALDRPAERAPDAVDLAFTTTGRRPVQVEVLDALPPEFELTAASNWFRLVVARGAPVRTRYVFTPALRGPYRVGPLVARSTDPLRLRSMQSLAAPAQEVQVSPSQEPVRRIPFTTRVPTVTLGPHFVNRAGEGSEFHALREYVQGDSLRSVNWKASARAGGLMVNQRVHESLTRLTLLLDARAVAGAGPANATPLADGCRVAVSLAAGALRVRDRIRFVSYGDGVTALADAPGSRQLEELTKALSGLPARGSTPLAAAVEELAPSLKPNTPVLVLSGLEGDPGFVDAVRVLRNRGTLPLAIVSPIAVAPATHEGPPEPGAQDLLRQREETLRGLRGLGIPVYETARGLPLDDLFRLGATA